MTTTSPLELFVFVFVLTVSVTARGLEHVVVKEGDDAVLPCSPSTRADIVTQLFDWRKDGQRKEVFMYNAGSHYNNGLRGQDEQFKGRVSHFPDQLKFGNASIKITQTEIKDGGKYTCFFPLLHPRETFVIELVIDVILKDRSRENSGAGRPVITIPDAEQTWSKLRCQVEAASPKPKVEWKNRAGNVLPAHEPQVSETGGFYDIILDSTVTETDRYHCVVTQEEIGHQAAAETFVSFCDIPNPPILVWLIAGMVTGVGVLAVVLTVVQAGLIHRKRVMKAGTKEKQQRWSRQKKVSLQELEVKGADSVEEGETPPCY